MAKINAINNESAELTIDPGASGDSFVQFDINGTGEFRIGVDDTDDSFRISQGSALGTNDTFIMTDAGERTMPLQPAFLGFLSSLDSNITGDGTAFTIGSGSSMTEVFDQNSDFNTNGTFTAPVTGRYHFTCSIQVQGTNTSHFGEFRAVTSNRTYKVSKNECGDILGSNAMEYSGDIFLDMDSSDTCVIQLVVSGSTKVVDTAAGSNPAPSWISGQLIV
jgi:hypothetical protein